MTSATSPASQYAASSAVGQRHFKHVWCEHCKKVSVMRIGAGGCYCGRIFGVYEVVRTPEETEDDDLSGHAFQRL